MADRIAGKHQVSFSHVWNPSENHVFFNTNQPLSTQPAPFFQASESKQMNHGKAYPQENFSTAPKKYQYSPSNGINLQHRPFTPAIKHSQAIMAFQTIRTPPSKRQRISSSSHQNEVALIASTLCRDNGCESTAAPSECCSSCPDGEICNEPTCAPWDEDDIETKACIAVPCTSQSCAEEACPAPCLAVSIQHQAVFDTQGPARNVSNWVDSGWDPQNHHDVPGRSGQHTERILDPLIPNFDGAEYVATSASPTPTTPSLVKNVKTTVLPNGNLYTSSFSDFEQPQNQYNNQSILSGTGQMFNPPLDEWSGQFSQFDDESSLFHCTWNGCGQTIMNTNDWLPHLHSEHIDPQMTFNCPIQHDSCPPTINDNPLNHLQKDHGYNFDLGEGSIGCPDPVCVEGGEVFCNPEMLHQHFDIVHAVPNQGVLRCQLNTCGTEYTGLDQLQSHFINDHRLPATPPKDNDINLQLTAPIHRAVKSESIPEVTEDKLKASPAVPHTCKWRSEEVTCGKFCDSEDHLQSHLRTTHLSQLDRSSGYKCQWEGCVRGNGDKAGFSQRGKLERHMASHTNFKCCKCDVCGQTFSAQQSLAQHKLLHTGEKPWKCAHCGKAFPQQSALTIHERTHTGLKPLKCEICGKAFSESSNLAKHRKIHNKSAEHECTFPGCGKRFVRLDQLKRHGRVHRRAAAGLKAVDVRSEKGDEEEESTVVGGSENGD